LHSSLNQTSNGSCDAGQPRRVTRGRRRAASPCLWARIGLANPTRSPAAPTVGAVLSCA